MAQGCSYATTFVDSFKWKFEQDDMPNIRLSVMAITSRGSEYISAEFADKDKSPELEIMYQLGKEYQDNVLSLDDMDERTKLQVLAIFPTVRILLSLLPKGLRIL